MEIKGVLRGLFETIAKRLGYEINKKEKTAIDFSADGLNPTAIGAAVITNIALDDSNIIISGNSERAKRLDDIKKYFLNSIENITCEIALGTGDALVRPYTDGKNIGLSVIGCDNFTIIESIGEKIKGIIIKLDEYETDRHTLRLFESQTLKPTELGETVVISRFAYRDNTEIDLSKTKWQGFESEETIFSNQLLVGRYKCPTLNRKNYNSANGVPITFGCEDIIENIKKRYNDFNDEYDVKKGKLFADRTLFSKNKNGELQYTGKNKISVVSGGLDGGIDKQISAYSPDIRDNSYKNGADFNFSILELCCGFSRGIFTAPETAFATATEMKNSLKKTFAFVKSFRNNIEQGNKELFNAIDIILNLNGETVGAWDIRHDWSYDYIESTTEKFNQLLQGHNVGAVKTQDLTAWVLGLDDEQAEKYVSEIKQEEAVLNENDFG